MALHSAQLWSDGLHHAVGSSQSGYPEILIDGVVEAYRWENSSNAGLLNFDTGTQEVATFGEAGYDLDVSMLGDGALRIEPAGLLLRHTQTSDSEDAGVWVRRTASLFSGLIWDNSRSEFGAITATTEPVQTADVTISAYLGLHVSETVLEQVSSRSWSSPSDDDTGVLYTKDVSGVTELFYQGDDGASGSHEIQLTNAGVAGGGCCDHPGTGSNTWLSPTTGTCSGSDSCAGGVGVVSTGSYNVVWGYGSADGGYNSIVAIGRNASATGQQSVAIGDGASASQGTVIIGYSPSTTGQYNVMIGHDVGGSGSSGWRCVMLGAGSIQSSYDGCILIGYGAVSTAAHQCLLGGNSTVGYVDQVYVGIGVAHASASSYPVTVQSSWGTSGNDGADLTIAAGGGGSGTDVGGDLYLQTAASDTLTTRIKVESAGDIIIGNPSGAFLRWDYSDGFVEQSPGANSTTTPEDGYNRAVRTMTTTDGTQTNMYRITTQTGYVGWIRAWVVATDSVGDVNCYAITTKYDNSGGSLTLGTVTSLYTEEDDVAYDATFTVSGADIRLSVTGDGTPGNVNWAATIEWQETVSPT